MDTILNYGTKLLIAIFIYKYTYYFLWSFFSIAAIISALVIFKLKYSTQVQLQPFMTYLYALIGDLFKGFVNYEALKGISRELIPFF